MRRLELCPCHQLQRCVCPITCHCTCHELCHKNDNGKLISICVLKFQGSLTCLLVMQPLDRPVQPLQALPFQPLATVSNQPVSSSSSTALQAFPFQPLATVLRTSTFEEVYLKPREQHVCGQQILETMFALLRRNKHIRGRMEPYYSCVRSDRQLSVG
jgi:hypothetical protein